MTDLSCKVSNCAYNQDCLCCKGEISVGTTGAKNETGTCCDSFMQQGEQVYQNSTCHASSLIDIDCEAVKCIYNDNYKCKAKKVDILGNGAMNREGTLCGTYREQ